ncbi:hypothetical protein PR048_016632 [Dryococelus australis]|uniref:Peroxidase n=1 Tax=Dryococelus australis TaxID=614101 RepID=A0ABQ9H7B0_9NEOP|nr:hypothetical protein PR048_016632 [Dryococelus australis]
MWPVTLGVTSGDGGLQAAKNDVLSEHAQRRTWRSYWHKRLVLLRCVQVYLLHRHKTPQEGNSAHVKLECTGALLRGLLMSEDEVGRHLLARLAISAWIGFEFRRALDSNRTLWTSLKEAASEFPRHARGAETRKNCACVTTGRNRFIVKVSFAKTKVLFSSFYQRFLRRYTMKGSSRTVNLLGQRTNSDYALKSLELKSLAIKSPLQHVPGGMKMVCASVVVGLFMLLVMQFGVESGLSKVDVESLRVPLALHNIIGDVEAAHRARRDVGGVPAELQEIDEEVVSNSVSFAEGVVSRMSRLEDNLASTDIRVHANTPAHGQLINYYPHIKAIQQGKDSLIVTKASLFLAQNTCQRFGHDDDKCGALVASIKLNGTRLGRKCSLQHGPFAACESVSKFRSVDGACNNPSQQSWGKALTGYQRLIFPHYGDGIQEPRRPVHGRALPSARKVTTLVTKEGDDLDSSKTLAVMQWAQFVEHDLVFTPASKMVTTGDSIMCCRQDGSHLPPRYIHPSCLPISIPNNDPFYAQSRVQCMNYVRSVSAFRSDCSFGPAEQLNQATHFLDGSVLYGSTADQAQALRTYVKGKLRSQFQNGQMFLPLSDKPTQYCQLSNPGTCYKAGDVRVNIQPDLVVMHTVWLREHNRVVAQLAELNPHWDDETLYQEARRVVVAELQHITYSEWLPTVVGDDYAKKMGLQISRSDFSMKYDENVNPTVSNSFATAAIRFLYSMMDGDLRLYDEGREANQSVPLVTHFNKPQIVEESDKLASLIRGLATQSAQKNDLKYVDDLKDLLYGDGSSYGMDVVSLDIQRGRDHGIPAYNYFRKLCGLPKAKKFSTFEDVMSHSTVQKLSAAYAHPDDVDLIVGGMAERPSGDGMLGPTFRCIIGEQMARTRKGDRYFYDLSGKPGSFSEAQLREIKKVSLARIFCDNGNGVETMQPKVFQRFSLSFKGRKGREKKKKRGKRKYSCNY